MIVGAGNIGVDDTQYVDGDIVREGTPQQGGEYRGGRGGAGNTVAAPPGSVGQPTAATQSEDVVPEPAMRGQEGYENYHTGRGGQGNIHRDEFGGHSHAQPTGKHESLLDKAKHAIGLDKKDKEGEPKPST